MSDAKDLGILVYEMKAFLQEAAGDYSLWNKTPARELDALLDALAAENEFLWTWVDRMARGELSQAECLNTITHRPGAPAWVLKYKLPVELKATAVQPTQQCPKCDKTFVADQPYRCERLDCLHRPDNSDAAR